jgi:drug/metabolite transporter (DMT)-like permease
MIVGYVFAILAMLSIGILGILSKLADKWGCTPLNTTLVLFGGSSIFMASYVAFVQRASLLPPFAVTSTALFFGALAVLAFWLFLFGLQFGKLTSSWIFMNLSAVVPAALSTFLYHEKISALKAFTLVLVVASIFLLWKDKQQESKAAEANSDAPARSNVKIWITAMLAAFFLNGVCPFGLRILAGRGLAEQYTAPYLVYWYLAGFAFGLLGLTRSRTPISKPNLLIGLVMALASVGGQFFMGLALSHGVPGSVVYMLGMGASMCVVVFGGAVFFHERIGSLAKVGIAIGLAAAILLGATG